MVQECMDWIHQYYFLYNERPAKIVTGTKSFTMKIKYAHGDLPSSSYKIAEQCVWPRRNIAAYYSTVPYYYIVTRSIYYV